jgi:hypothetical protein
MRGGATPSASLPKVSGETADWSPHGDRNPHGIIYDCITCTGSDTLMPEMGTVSGPIRVTRQMVVRYRMARVEMQPKGSEQTQR